MTVNFVCLVLSLVCCLFGLFGQWGWWDWSAARVFWFVLGGMFFFFASFVEWGRRT